MASDLFEVSPDQQGPDLERVHEALVVLDFSPDDADIHHSFYGDGTRAAYKQRAGLAPTGVVDAAMA